MNISVLLDVAADAPKIAPGLATPTIVAPCHHAYVIEIFFDILVDLWAEGGKFFEPCEEFGLESNVAVACPIHSSFNIEVVKSHEDGYDITTIVTNGLLVVV